MLAPPRIEYTAASVPKDGNREQENEDAHWPRCPSSAPVAGPRFRCAVADGATAAAFSGEWAEQLVSAFGEGTLPNVTDAHLAGLRTAWNEKYRNAALPWYMEEKVLRGSFAAFLGLEIRSPLGKLRAGRWRAVVVGDCCLFSVRRDSIRVRFPYSTAAQFGDRPYLIATSASPEAPLDGQRQVTWGRWQAGDTFFLMSDAVAAWFLHGIRQGQRPWRRVNPALTEPAAFQRFVAELRQGGEMKNDDVTIVRVMVS